MSRASDAEIIAEAVTRNAVVVTYDGDLHKQLAEERAERPSVIRIRVERLPHQRVAELIMQAIEQSTDDLLHGAAVSITEHGIRVHRLPIIGG
jgi:predicted nuclease of predicted toxin-antitoxin system